MILRQGIIRKLRERFNFTQLELAHNAKVSLSTITAIERGHTPTLETLLAVADVFHVDYRDLLEPPAKQPANDAICKLLITATK
jgi:transcriptional regulator with XRE-family HTH domain